MASNAIIRATMEYTPILFVESFMEDDTKAQIEQFQRLYHPKEPIRFVDRTNGHAQRTAVLDNMGNLTLLYLVWDDQSRVDGSLVLHCREDGYGRIQALRLNMQDAIGAAWKEHMGLCTFDKLVESGKGIEKLKVVKVSFYITFRRLLLTNLCNGTTPPGDSHGEAFDAIFELKCLTFPGQKYKPVFDKSKQAIILSALFQSIGNGIAVQHKRHVKETKPARRAISSSAYQE
ncbi:hypothetical protein BGX26_003651 [Mortierella sp. AD094]|nr:hypothetical protein BGX26_003651 [Mortierella sp. AD094]